MSGYRGHPWLVLSTVMVGTLLIGLDRTVVNLAVPKVIDDFGITVSAAAWIATAYIITNAVFVPVFGKLGDLYGNRVIYVWSFIGFILVSLLAGLSWSFGSLVAFRAVQGLVGAAIYPTAMSLIAKSFVDPKARAQALGIWSSSFAVSAVIGPLLGGYLIDHFSWRMIFYINLPIGLAGLAMTIAFLPHDRPAEQGAFDWFGSVLLAGAVSSMALVLDQGQSWGWGSSASVACYVAVVCCGILTYLWETRHPHPVLDFKLFRNPTIVSVLAVSFISFGGMMGAMFLLPVFTETFLGYDAIQSGLLFVPLGLALPIAAPLGAKLASTFHPRYTVAFGMALAGLSFYLLRHLDPGMGFGDFVIPLALFGFGLGLGMAPLTNAATTAVELHEVGMSSGLLNLTRNIGGAFGIAILGTVLNNATNADVLRVAEHSVIRSANPAVIRQGVALIELKADLIAYGTVFTYAALSMVAGGALALFLLKRGGPGAALSAEARAEAMAGG
ncbi:MAG: DHA2 family efflux MFS transporter permease subunit [Patescibacteria group bacterium]|nr:DHA2 family efflux MFS transporter permease subunit [Patescibacteria group bacterium]MDE1944353.1 DHA2 family efflux MFS transporter permease subunit [Patescibacteria group bacterium]MDE1945247.1 DHA2 family efflux MFS transporter permease subunit [Patescibacteria group bacterium]MDE2057978.1 DHA2 family efflux MFS transporter permease subunit [Patescibacteria group bacterium]